MFLALKYFKSDVLKNVQYGSIEKGLFLLITGLNLIPVFTGKFFPTLDGPAHLYNSRIISELLFNGQSSLGEFFIFNPDLVPNWSGHALLSLLMLIFPAFVAEKILLVVCLIVLPFSFRSLIKTISPHSLMISYLIFPFTYSFTFFLGFYNFSIGLILMLIILNYWIKNHENILSAKKLIVLFFLFGATYFSHAFVFGILMLLLAIHLCFSTIVKGVNENNQTKKIVLSSLKKAVALIASAGFFVTLFCIYLYFKPSPEEKVFFSSSELVQWIKSARPIIALSVDEEQPYSKKIFYLIVIMLIISAYNRINTFKSYDYKTSIKEKVFVFLRHFFTQSEYWFVATGIILVLYFTLPDMDEYAGYVSVRLLLLFFLLLILWLSTQRLPRWLILSAAIVSLYCSFSLNKYYISAVKGLNKSAVACHDIAKHIDPESIVLPLNYSDNWLHAHFSNYLGVDKPMVVLENYECGTGYFPLKYNEVGFPNILLGKTSSKTFPCVSWQKNENNVSRTIDYVFIMGKIPEGGDTCTIKLVEEISNNYTLVYSYENSSLYRGNHIKQR